MNEAMHHATLVMLVDSVKTEMEHTKNALHVSAANPQKHAPGVQEP